MPGYKANDKNKTRKLRSIEKETDIPMNNKKTNILKQETGFLF